MGLIHRFDKYDNSESDMTERAPKGGLYWWAVEMGKGKGKKVKARKSKG